MKPQILLVGAVALLMSGCVTVTDPVPMGEGRYMISLNARGGFQNNGELLGSSTTNRGLHTTAP